MSTTTIPKQTQEIDTPEGIMNFCKKETDSLQKTTNPDIL